METLKQEFSDLREETSIIIEFGINLDKGINEGNNICLSLTNRKEIIMPSLKASIVLMLYNAVESTCSKCLQKIHETICSESLDFNKLSKHIRKILLTYYDKSINTPFLHNNKKNKIDYEIDKIDYILNYKNFGLSYEDMKKNYELFSGNLDDAEIKSVFKKYGIKIEENEKVLGRIKNERNDLAHGRKTFEEVGRDYTWQELKKKHASVFDYLEIVLTYVCEYISNAKYKEINIL